MAKSTFDSAYELGKLYCDRGDFSIAIDKMKEAADGYFSEKDFANFLKCQNLLLRMYAEREQAEDINETKEKLQDLVLKEGVELSSKTYYTLGLCSSYKDQYDFAIDYFKKALTIALATDSKEDICYAICGLAITYARMGLNAEALKEIYNLEVFFQVLDLPELKLTAKLTNANILLALKKYDQALELCWQCYESLKDTKSMTLFPYLLFSMGINYSESGEKELARVYLNLAYKSVDPQNMVRLSRLIEFRLKEMGGQQTQQSFDLIFEKNKNTVLEKKIGEIDFKNQFILLDLLKLFVQNPGQVYSKESLVETVWKQSYDPSVHDNKIYVTIKRLRKMIEPDYEKPKYIFRAKNGYYLNKTTKVLFEN